MTDIHSHILPGIDDGAKSLEESLALLRAELQNGVDTVVLTPHFHMNMSDLDKFLIKREKAFKLLFEEAANLPVKLMTGAEVRYSADLLSLNLLPLRFGGKGFLLIELPESHLPHLAADVLYDLTLKGITPVIAHIERCSYLIGKPELIDELVSFGAYMQVNADSLLRDRRTCKQLLKLIAEDRAHIIASDAHSMKSRPPMLANAMAVVEKKLGKNVAARLEKNARAALG